MTATARGLRADAPGRAGAVPLTAALLLVLSGVFALPAGLYSSEYHSDSWAVAAVAGPASVLPTLVLAAAAVASGSRILLFVSSALTMVHLVALATLASAAADGPVDPQLFLSGPVELGLALVGLTLGWWDVSRTRRRPGIALLVVALAPALGLLVDARQAGDGPWYLIGLGILLLQQVPALLTVLAAGLVCLPGRGARAGGAALIALTGAGLLWADSLFSPAAELSGLRLAAIAAALLCALVATAQASSTAADAEDDEPATPDEPTGHGRSEPETEPKTETEPPTTPADDVPVLSGLALPAVALAILVLATGLDVLKLFAQGPGIRPDLAGMGPLLGFLVDAALLAVLTLTAGAVTLGTRGALVVASGCSGLLLLVLLASRMTAGGRLTPHEVLPFVALGPALALGWVGTRPERVGTVLRWAVVVPLVLVASPLLLLTDPGVDLGYLSRYLMSYPVAGAGPVVAAALLGFPRRGTRLAAAVLLTLIALIHVYWLMYDTSGLRVAVALDLAQICGYGLAAALAAAAALPRRGETGQPAPPAG
ncbi:hypothetical protein [Promicromonospora sukumoe]|uniref:hypothetical protein n=1 Tax=Promicromonospora sukumoe TaxID=88382 RepID=UPI000377AEA9|nr:hypothetical protein [Promicromonospora sukumoe]